MSNQNEFSWQDAMRSGQTLFSQMLEDAIMSLEHDDLLMPHMNDYRIDAMSGGEPVIEFDLHLSAYGLQRIVVPFTDDQAIIAASVAEIRARLADVLDNLHDLLQLLLLQPPQRSSTFSSCRNSSQWRQRQWWQRLRLLLQLLQ